MASHWEAFITPDTSRQSLSRKRDPLPPKNHHKMRAKLGAKPLSPHQQLGQKWTRIALSSLDTPTHPPASSAKKAPSEVQILLPRPGLRQEALL